MGEEGSHEIPCLDFSGVGSDKESEAWKVFRGKVREACESHGCFLLNYGTDKITGELREEMFMATRHLFDLPLETKEKHSSPSHNDTYIRPSSSILHESFGIKSSHQLHFARAFSNLMWPSDGNPSFCELLSSISSKFLELNLIIMKVIFESFGMENYYEFVKENNTTHFRIIKYNPPLSNDIELGIVPHTDENFVTTLCQNEVQGLEVLSKQGNWIQVIIPDGYYFVIVGDALKAWSNGRLSAAKHRVMMKGGKERFSLGSFLAPTDETIIEAPRKLVDENHPLVYRPYTFSEYVHFLSSNNYPEGAVELYAGI